MQMSFAPLVKATAPAVVNIYASKLVRERRGGTLFDDPFFRRFFGENFSEVFPQERQRQQNSLGSGVIVRADGIIVTNEHVIKGADQIKVVLADRREFDARVLGKDDRTDLAVLAIETQGEALAFLEFADSDALEVGDIVLAIGNPFGVGQTVTSGIVSALARTGVGISDLNSFVQTDAAINPGNSGGALVGLDGRLIGINTAIFSKSGGSLGIGFATPSNLVRTVMTGVIASGGVVRPWFGAWGQAVSADIAGSMGMARPQGVLINSVYPGSPAARASIKVGDVVLAVDGHPVDDPESLRYRIATRPANAPISVSLQRGSRRHVVSVALSPPPETPPRDVTLLDGNYPLAGAEVANMSPALGDELGLKAFVPGVVITRIRRDSPALRLDFKPGDMIRAVNGAAATDVRSLERQLTLAGNEWRITFARLGKTYKVTFSR